MNRFFFQPDDPDAESMCPGAADVFKGLMTDFRQDFRRIGIGTVIGILQEYGSLCIGQNAVSPDDALHKASAGGAGFDPEAEKGNTAHGKILPQNVMRASGLFAADAEAAFGIGAFTVGDPDVVILSDTLLTGDTWAELRLGHVGE